MTQWQKMLEQIKKEFKNNPNGFLQEKTIARTTHPKNEKLAKKYYDLLKNTNTFAKYKWKEPPFANPAIAVDNMSLSTIQSLYHIDNISAFVDILDCDHIVEIGGGYGNLCSLVKNAGYTKEWTIIDFPEMHTIQRKYIEAVSSTDKVNFIQLKELSGIKADLFIATFSMNEMPLSDRKFIEDNVDNFQHFYIQHNARFDGINNIDYFKKFMLDNSENYDIIRRDCKIYPNHPIILANKK